MEGRHQYKPDYQEDHFMDLLFAFDNNVSGNTNWHAFYNTSETSADTSTWSQHQYFIFAMILILATVGIAGNLMSCIVLKLYLLRLSGTYVLFLFLSVADSLVVIVLTIEALYNSFLLPTFVITPVQCKCFRFFWYFSLQLSAWLIVTLSVERYVTLRFFHVLRDREMILRRAWITGSLIVLSVIGVNLHLLFTTGMSKDVICGYITIKPKVTQRIVNAIQILFGWFLPYLVTFSFNIALILHTWRCSRPSHVRTTVLLLTITFAFIFLTLPYTINIFLIQHIFPNVNSLTVDNVNVMNVSDDVVRYLLFLNNSLNFVFYISGRQFRRAVRHMFFGSNRARRNSVTRSSFSLNTKEVFVDTTFHPIRTNKTSLSYEIPE